MKYVVDAGVVILGISAVGLMPPGREHVAPFPEAPPRTIWPGADVRAPELRGRILRRARVWQPNDIAAADLSTNPADAGGELSRTTVRLFDELKAQAERAAAEQGVSLNTYISRAISDSVRGAVTQGKGRRGGRTVNGYIQG